ncbi:hypothetical protein RhiirB3_476201, partial [Rhizophagus irregularis]
MSPRHVQFLNFWQDMFMNNKIVDIDILPEPKPDGYAMAVSGLDLQFPFSFYFMKQIDNFKTLYEEEISLLRKDRENIDPSTEKLLEQIYENYIKEFTNKVFNSITLLRTSPLEQVSDLYFKDFVNIVCNSEASLKDISVLSYILKCKIGNEKILNPILLHTFWWEHANSTLAACQLVHMCPDIINYTRDLTSENFDDYLVGEVTNTMLRRIIESQETTELQREIKKVLNLCEKISSFIRTESLQLLQICYDLLLTELIQLKPIKEIIKIGETDDKIFSTQFIHEVFEMFRNIEPKQTNKITFAKQSFVMKTNGRGKCPECGNMIGGMNHVSEAGNTRLDDAPIRTNLVAKDEKGYIAEAENEDINHNVRNLPPASYRILHLFVHSIIGVWAPSNTANTFLRKNNNVTNDSLAYCMGHIKNDWKVLLKILNCPEESLALLLHAILNRMTLNPPKDSALKTSEEREEWEAKFAQNYVSPLIKNVTNTVTEFRAKLDAALTKTQGSSIIEGEVNQTLLMDQKYKLEHLPRLWRSIGTISFQGFRAYYNSDIEKHETYFPFISVFFRYFDKLEKVKYLWPIVNFVQIISSRLGYRLSRERAQ